VTPSVKGPLVGVVLVALLAVGVIAMREATQNRPDVVVAGSSTVLTFSVEHRRYQRGEEAAALALWTTCSASVAGEVSLVPQPVAGGWQVRIAPALGEHGRKRLVGCLEDTTIDRVIGRVEAVASR